MIEYARDQHEMLVLKWYLDIAADKAEFENLFCAPLRNLTEILFWAQRTVKLFFDYDAAGIWIATWFEPCMSGAYFGCWVRKDKRQTKAMLKFVDDSLDSGLEHFPVLVAATKQERLQSELVRLGFVRDGNGIPYLFDGAQTGIYYLTKETRADKEARRNGRRRRKNIEQQHIESIRASAGVVRSPELEDDQAGLEHFFGPDGGSAPDGGSERADTEYQRELIEQPPSLQPKLRGRKKSLGLNGTAQ